MDISEYECTICLEVCNEAVESLCCISLYCEKCTSGIQECPSCRAENFQVASNRYVRKAIGRMKVSCEKCKMLVQRDGMMDHEKVCSMRQLRCAAVDCEYKGAKEEFLNHMVKCHENDLLIIGQRLNKAHAFQLQTVDTSMQVSVQHVSRSVDRNVQTDCHCVVDKFVQTDFDIPSQFANTPAVKEPLKHSGFEWTKSKYSNVTKTVSSYSFLFK